MRSNVTGGGLYNSEYRNLGRGFGRRNPKPFQPSQPQPSPKPPRRGDLFIEAGRLAVEYLVSHGLLASNVLSGKTQNGNLRNNSGESHDHRSSKDGEIPNSLDGRSVATTRPGSGKSPNDQDHSVNRNYSKERNKDSSCENGREGSLSDKEIASEGLKENNDNLEDTTRNADVDTTKDDGKITMTSLLQDKDDKEFSKPSDGVNSGCEETKDGSSNHDMEKETSIDELSIQHCEEKSNTSSNNIKDLLKLFPSTKIPTKVRSSMINKSPKGDPFYIDNTEHASLDSLKDDNMNNSLGIPSSNEIPSSNCLDTALSDQQKSMDLLSFTDKTFSYEQKSRGEKRALEQDNMEEGAKKAKQWLSVAQSDEYSQLSDLSEKQTFSPPKSGNQESFNAISLTLDDGVQSAIEQGEDKQLFSSSFKICDLNLKESSDIHEDHDVSVLLYPSISAPSKDVAVDIDLSRNNNYSLANKYNDSGVVKKEIEIIDLECESLPEDKSMNTSTKMESGITSMETFPNISQNSNNNPDGQDGYGFMISEFLGNDVPNCSPVPPEINSLDNEMGLHHGEGMFTEDDPIYMSLGEIPLSMPGLLRVWEQPTQERNPFEL